MAKKKKAAKTDKSENGAEDYDHALYDLQVELVKLQKDVIANNRRLLIIMEGRDGAGKDGTIKRITEHMSPRETRVVALGKPSDREEIGRANVCTPVTNAHHDCRLLLEKK